MRKILKILSALMCVLMLSLCLLSCKKDGGTDTESGTETAAPVIIDISEYAIVRAEYAHDKIIEEALVLQATIKEKTGKELALSDDWLEAGTDASAKKEILIGAVDRDETAAVTFVESDGYVIRFTESKIILLGQTDELTVEAVRYFSENYLKSGSAELSAVEHTGGIGETQALLYDSKTDYTVVFQENRGSAEFDDNIYTFCTELGKLGGIDMMPMYSIILGREYDENTKQILIGETGYPETEELKSTLGYDEYAWKRMGNKIVIFGYSNETLKLAMDDFLSYAQYCSYSRGGKSGVVLSAVKEEGAKREGWFDTLPKYAGGKFRGATSSGSNNFVGVIEQTNMTEYEAYGALLQSEGYTKRAEADGISIVSDTYVKGEDMVHIYYLKRLYQTRIVTGTTDQIINDSAAGEKVTDAQVVHNRLDIVTVDEINGENTNSGLGLIVTLEDGRFIIIDAGRANCGHAEQLYKYLTENNKRSDGVVIAAWYITHNHIDHSGGFTDFSAKYAKSGNIKLEQLIFGQFSVEQCYESEYELGSACLPSNAKNIMSALQRWEGAEYKVPFTGMVHNIGGATLEIMLTNSDWYPDYHYYDNDASTIGRITINGKSLLVLGDNEVHGANKLLSMYSDEHLKSYIVQMGHHGKGSSVELYRAVAADWYYFSAAVPSFNYHATASSITGKTIAALGLSTDQFMAYGKEGNPYGLIMLTPD